MIDEIVCQQGEPVELRLPHAMQWSLRLDDPDHILVPQEPQGELDEASQQIVWRFSTVGTGNATAMLTGRPIVRPGAMRPHFVMAREFAITVR
jgi:hypothetical protein